MNTLEPSPLWRADGVEADWIIWRWLRGELEHAGAEIRGRAHKCAPPQLWPNTEEFGRFPRTTSPRIPRE